MSQRPKLKYRRTTMESQVESKLKAASKMKCSRCGRIIGTDLDPAYQVRVGYEDDDGNFMPEAVDGYYCSYCLVVRWI